MTTPDRGLRDESAVWLPLAEVRRWDKNPRNNTAAIPKVAASIARFGFVAPAVVWRERGQLIAGHTRMSALESLLAADPTFIPPGAPPGVVPGMMPVRFHPFASEAEATAYGIADNRLGEIAEWDTAALTSLLAGLEAPLIDLIGFSPAEVGSLIPGPSLPTGGKGSDPYAEWAGMPAFEQNDDTPHRTVAVHFADDAAIAAFAKLLGVSVTDKTRSVWYPAVGDDRETGMFSDRAYVTDE